MPDDLVGLHERCGGEVTRRSWVERHPYGMGTAEERWTAYDCGRCGEIGGDEVLMPGQETYCDGCGRPFRRSVLEQVCRSRCHATDGDLLCAGCTGRGEAGAAGRAA